ncbi:phenylalanine--tRNA ligase subunit beta [Labrys wisconsinensis]|uniref:Phenylalanine--tRNA ligase beta subunit n=1 Tax=Labrys wisconsinensis TaxID=425677 RepID=A0ABU0IYT8_9HYPH|nr:phenylalanine--tRNA ligase subunit beta [Labrys wisconsinensis]MDQ0467172.1 phenylalanyl-tRNA synthetase beta chain [Labrys wisconsinensis]
MKFTLSWLKDHLDTDASLDAVVETLTRIGLEVERVEDRARALAPFTIAAVVSAEQHPNADKLRVCMVDTGSGSPVQVVCGAPNARAGMRSVFSPPGTYIPGKDITLGIGSIRGIESRGMLCSGAELEISSDHDGILDLPADAPVGAPYAAWAGLDDPIIEINLTPNRPDCTGVAGIARDLAAAGLGRLKTPPVPAVEGRGPCPVSVTLDFGDGPSLCPAFALRLVRGVRNGPSPDWLQRRLTAIGLRPINALVDITNYVTFDRGRPLHVFDAAKVKGDLTVRRAREGESVLALDGRTYALDPTMCVIADGGGVESIAGIMGGEHSGCDAATTDVLIESALWEPLNVARTGRTLGINTDARYRFERGVDPAFMVPGAELATALVLELCGGEPTELTMAGAVPGKAAPIAFPLAEVRRLTGLDTPEAEILRILASLGFEIAGNGPVRSVTPPTWRPDIEGKADLVEEVMRIVGVDAIPVTPLPREAHVPAPVLTPIQKRTRLAKRALAARGLMEAVTWSFIARAQAVLFGGGQPALALANPIAADLSDMRPSLIPGLAAAAQRNADRGNGDVALFEVGQVFRGDKPEDQKIAAAGLRRGLARPGGGGRHWSAPAAPAGAFDAKEDALALLGALGAPVDKLQIVPGGPAWFHPGRSGTIQLGPQTVIGWFGELHPAALEGLDVAGPLAAFEIVLDQIPLSKPKPTKSRGVLDVSAFQPVTRDLAFVVDRSVKAADIVKTALGADKKLVADVAVFDVYEGRGVEPGAKSVAVAVTLQPREKTLTDAEIEAVVGRIVAEVARKTGATLRA